MSRMRNTKNSGYVRALNAATIESACLCHADCREALTKIPDASVALTHTSPPYNIRRQYRGFRDRQDLDEYQALVRGVLEQLSRVTRPGGSIFWQVGYTSFGPARNGESDGIKVLDAMALPIAEDAGFRLWDRIIWNYFGSMAFRAKFTNRHETILWLVKPDQNGTLAPLFQLDAVRERSKEYDGRNHILGRNPGNVWASERVAFGTAGQTSHIAVFPEEVSEKIVRACSREGELVLDPFSGSGTLPKVAFSLGRRTIGCEISEEYVREAESRLRLWGASEEENLALGLLVRHGFHGRPGSKSIRYLGDVLEIFVSRDEARPELVELESAVGEIRAAERVTKEIKCQKQSLWQTYDALINARDESDEIIAADRALAFCYAHRARWNGVRRYLSAGRAIRDLSAAISAAGGSEAYVGLLCDRADARFERADSQIALCRVDAGLGCRLRQTRTRSARSDTQMTFSSS